ncbi:hypothetical protein E2R51_09190 [Jeotgalibacillus sp. S-D1]|uniref:hypothetical protein n=1 Tax=Jeotgalibacillus sp. S-D1 TaxID=2552189 RepID=UPI00105A4E8D|nr:hypothetical protein [Jeotgalibacillus sp. S-D1]TDL32835.1 hypothetical protein E2R51_09190 [Jeotgalibacillus sp. S-D1]
MSKVNKIKSLLDDNPQYQDALFSRGYLITSKNIKQLDLYPFYNNWKVFNEMPKLNMYVHNKQQYYSYEVNGVYSLLIGNAYNPFTMQSNESDLLKDSIECYLQSEENFLNKISEFTGIHLIVVIDGDKLIAVQDCSGMKSCYFGKVDDELYITSHPQLVGDICNLSVDSFVEELTSSRSYNIGNRHLPGNITPYKELKRLGGNTFLEYNYSFKIKRFYPLKPHKEINTNEEYEEGIKNIYQIMHQSMEITSIKWNKPAISLTGGTDSKTTLACTNGLYDKFSYFSYHCKPSEIIDANAAHEICNEINVTHDIYSIPDNNEEIKDFDIFKKIIDHNTSYFKNTADHEIRKMIYLYNLDKFDVEVKSWASETARVFLERKYGLKMPEVLSERHMSIFQTRYFLVPGLLKKSDNIYKGFLKEVDLEKPLFNFEHSDLFYWEVRMGAWGTSVVSSFDLCHEVTIPMNNRRLLEMFLSFSHQDRKSDKVHNTLIETANKKIANMNIYIPNNYFKSYRIWIEKIYYHYRTLLYKKK